MLGNGGVAGGDVCLHLLVESNFMVNCYCSLLVLVMFRSMNGHMLASNCSEQEVTCGRMTTNTDAKQTALSQPHSHLVGDSSKRTSKIPAQDK